MHEPATRTEHDHVLVVDLGANILACGWAEPDGTIGCIVAAALAEASQAVRDGGHAVLARQLAPATDGE
jgi:hypothetical protein